MKKNHESHLKLTHLRHTICHATEFLGSMINYFSRPRIMQQERQEWNSSRANRLWKQKRVKCTQ